MIQVWSWNVILPTNLDISMYLGNFDKESRFLGWLDIELIEYSLHVYTNQLD